MVRRVESGEDLVKRTEAVPNEGLVALLLGRPVKDWFTPADWIPSTDIVVPDLE
jgi:hypothetical protein